MYHCLGQDSQISKKLCQYDKTPLSIWSQHLICLLSHMHKNTTKTYSKKHLYLKCYASCHKYFACKDAHISVAFVKATRNAYNVRK